MKLMKMLVVPSFNVFTLFFCTFISFVVLSNDEITEHVAASKTSDLTLYFNQQGKDWESESLPIGNGSLGATVLGGINNDVIQFSEKTLWTGGPNSIEGYDYGIPTKEENFPEKVVKVQQLLAEHHAISPDKVVKDLGRKVIGYGSYQSFADLHLLFDHDLTQVSQYKRSLDLKTAVATLEYHYQGVNFTREYFVSYPDQVLVVKISSDSANKVSFDIDLNTPLNRTVTKVARLNSHNKAQASLGIAGKLNDNGLVYESQLKVITNEGTVSKNTNNQLQVSNANSVWLVLAAATNYQQKYPHYRGQLPNIKVVNLLNKAMNFSYQDIKKRHLADYQQLFSRVSLDLDHDLPNVPINKLLAQYKTGKTSASNNRALERLYYQFGRYLLIASSRKGSLPANLQGVWNKHEYAPWSADYHVNINLQMNYWLADMTNLSETNAPLFDFIDSLIAPGELTAKNIFNADGWVMFLNTNAWGFTGPIEWPTAFWQPEGAAWMALHYFEHYLFTQNTTFLTERAYPVLKKASEFWLDTLVRDKKSQQYLVSPSYSPEHGNFSVATSMSQQIVSKLFVSTLLAASVTKDEKFIKRLTQAISALDPGLEIGSWGQLQEWQQDLDKKDSKHRHVSHLFALHPGNTISPLTTPELSAAAKISLNARGDGGTGWSKAWKINFWSRLFDGERAHKLLSEQLKHSTLSNLWDNHPPFQIDGNFGATAGITEMLLQSQNDELHLLPALPNSWPEGKIKGLKARGNIEVDIQWQLGKFEQAKIKSALNQHIKIRVSGVDHTSKVIIESGLLIPSKFDSGVITFAAKENITYLIKP